VSGSDGSTASAGYARPAIAGSGAIACGLAACASALGEVRLLARSQESLQRAERDARDAASKLDGGSPSRISLTTDAGELEQSDLIVEAIVEDLQTKSGLIAELAGRCPGADLATTTSSLRISELAGMAGLEQRLFGLHVFNPVTRMKLVELCLPPQLDAAIRTRATAWCEALGKRAVEVPDQSGFVVNRLLFPFLFDAVRMLEGEALDAAAVDACMTLGAGHPMGPLELLDFVGLDVAVAIGEELHGESGLSSHEPPRLLRALVAEGRLGRKSGAGFHNYE
jgi:3-hydroxybutyryl-CoA dehydrogenase